MTNPELGGQGPVFIALKDREKQMRLEAEESRKKLREHHEHLQEVRAKELELRRTSSSCRRAFLSWEVGLGSWCGGRRFDKRQRRWMLSGRS